MSAFALPSSFDEPANWLSSTPHVNHQHPRVIDTAASVTARRSTNRDRALALFRFVRSEIKFGFCNGFWDNRASDLLKSRTGYCNTKSTLFTALLRATGIPARQVFVDIDASVLSGILDPGTPYVDHSYVEVFLDDRWVATDAYIVDEALFAPAQARTLKEGRVMGYGVHSTGTLEWDGVAPSFAQFNVEDPRPISTRNWGAYEDVADFYRNAADPWNRLNPLLRFAVGAIALGANLRADGLRNTRR